MSVARPLRSTLEQVADALPDIVMLGLGILIFSVFIGPISGFIGNIRGLVGSSSGGGATIQPTGTHGSVDSFTIRAPHLPAPLAPLDPYRVHPPLVGPFSGNRFAWTQAYADSYTPINRFLRQLYFERQQ